jgi:CRISPR-associated protein Csb2
LLRFAEQPPSAALSGHLPDGRPNPELHVAFVALPGAGRERAISAVAIGVPAELDESAYVEVIASIGAWQQACGGRGRLTFGALGAWRLAPLSQAELGSAPPGLGAPALRWRSLTPIVLDRFPKRQGNSSGLTGAALKTTRASISRACQRMNLPAPAAIELRRRAFHDDIPDAPVFGAVARERRASEVGVYTHAELVFDAPVRGPLLIGRGRFFGFGLFEPQPETTC